MNTVKRYLALPILLSSMIPIGLFGYLLYLFLYYYTSSLSDISSFDSIFLFIGIKGDLPSFVSLFLSSSLLLYNYMAYVEKMQNPLKIDDFFYRIFNKARFIEVGKTMHYALITARILFFYLAFIISILLIARTSSLGSGLNPVLQMVNPDYYLNDFRYLLVFFLVFELFNTFFIKTKESVSFLFLLNLFIIVPISAFIFNVFNMIDFMDIVYTKETINLSELNSILGVLCIVILLNIAYIHFNKKSKDKEKISIKLDFILPTFVLFIVQPLAIAFFLLNGNFNFSNDINVEHKGEIFTYRQNIPVHPDNSMFQEDFFEQSIGYPFKIKTHFRDAIILARHNNLDDEFLDVTMNILIKQIDLYKEHRNRILDIKLEDSYKSDFFLIKMLQIFIGVSDLEKTSVFYGLIKNKDYQEAWEMHQESYMERINKPNINANDVISSKMKGEHISTDQVISDIFVHLHHKGIIDMNVDEIVGNERQYLSSSINNYDKLYNKLEGKTEYQGMFDFQKYSVDEIKSIIKRHQ